MDVSDQILKTRQLYGSSDNTAPSGLAASGNFNYAAPLSINNPLEINISTIPYTFEFRNTVGLFGAENAFVKINMDVDSTGTGCVPFNTYTCVKVTQGTFPIENYYEDSVFDSTHPDNDPFYESMEISNESIGSLGYNLMISILLDNLGTGNSWIDRWFDVRLYTNKKEEHPYELMYTPAKYSFYIGFHARNTKRLPYEVNCTVGTEFKPFGELGADKRYVARELH